MKILRHITAVLCVAVILPARAADNPFAALGELFFGPKITVAIDHPPALPLKVSAIALAKPEGRCGDDLASRVEQDFVNSSVTVIDRQRFQDVLRELKLQANMMFDQSKATQVGQHLGAQALLFLNVFACNTKNRREEGYTDKKTRRTYYNYVTEGSVTGSVRVVDLTTGRVLAAQHFEGGGSLQSGDAYPDRDAALRQAHEVAAQSIHRMLLPWSETKTLVFYDDSGCDLKKAARLLKAKDFDGALKQSAENLEACRNAPGVKPATIARAYYNLGMLQFVQRDYDAALANLGAADQLQSSKVFLSAITECKQAKQHALTLAQASAGQPELQPPVKMGSPSPAKSGLPKKSAGAQSIEDRLARLEGLRDKKAITQAEYERLRAQILNEI